MSEYPVTPRTRLRRKPDRGRSDRATVHAILDEAFVCHVAFAEGDHPACIPMVYARRGEAIFLHGSAGNRALRALRDGAPACAVVTLLDGLVFGRSAFHSSVNYRSVVIYGTAREVADPAEKDAALRAILEHAMPGRLAEVRAPSEREVLQTLVLRLPLDEVSAKVRTGPPVDEEEDYARAGWAGVLPLALVPGEPEDDPRLPAGVRAPHCVRDWARRRAS